MGSNPGYLLKSFLLYFRNRGKKLGIILKDSDSKLFEAIKEFSDKKCWSKLIFWIENKNLKESKHVWH